MPVWAMRRRPTAELATQLATRRSPESSRRDEVVDAVASASLRCSTMFKEALKEVVDRTDGAMGALLMDASGIALESYSKNDAAFDVNNIGIEFSVVLSSVKRASEMLETGAAAEVTISSEKLITVLRCIGDTYFVALAVSPTGNVGKGRFLLRLAEPKLLAEL